MKYVEKQELYVYLAPFLRSLLYYLHIGFSQTGSHVSPEQADVGRKLNEFLDHLIDYKKENPLTGSGTPG